MHKIEKQIMNNKTNSFYGYESPKEYNVSFFPNKNGVYVIEIDSTIEEVSQFSTAIRVLGMAKQEDQVEIHLQCPGGNVDAAGAMLHAMHKCEADVHIVASGGCHSASTHILLAADSFELAENFNALIHNGSSGSIGAINEYHAKSDFDKPFIYNLYKEIYEGFLSDAEFVSMMDGKNIWLNAADWCERATKRQAYFEAKYKAFQEAEQAPTAKAKPSRKASRVKKEA